MAIKSMTGFGRAENADMNRRWFVEVRCVNHRYLDLKMKLPRGYTELEEKMRKLVGQYHLRGRVDLSLTVSGDFTDLVKVKTNIELAKVYKDSLLNMAEELELEPGVDLRQITAFPDVLVTEQSPEDLNKAWPFIEKAMQEALEKCDVMKKEEGEALTEDLLGRLKFFSETVENIEENIPDIVAHREKTLKARLDKLLNNVQLDPMRLAQEVAVMVDKTDVTEEVVRLKSHINQFKKFLRENVAIGRKLDFLIQEFLREVNTLASKINDADIAHLTVDLKSELEKMREQVQNIE